MSRIIRYDTTTGKVLELISDGIATEWEGRAGVLIDPDESQVSSPPLPLPLPVSQWRVDLATFALRPASDPETTSDTAQALESRRVPARESAIRLLADGLETGEPISILMRVLLRVISQENARIKAGQPVRSAQELWAAMRNFITSGQGDVNL